MLTSARSATADCRQQLSWPVESSACRLSRSMSCAASSGLLEDWSSQSSVPSVEDAWLAFNCGVLQALSSVVSLHNTQQRRQQGRYYSMKTVCAHAPNGLACSAMPAYSTILLFRTRTAFRACDSSISLRANTNEPTAIAHTKTACTFVSFSKVSMQRQQMYLMYPCIN